MKITYKIVVSSFQFPSFTVEFSADWKVENLFKILNEKFPQSEGYKIQVFKIEETVKTLITETWQ